MERGDVDAGLQLCDEILPSLVRYGHPAIVAYVRTGIGETMFRTGNFERAVQEFHQAVIAAGTGVAEVHARLRLGGAQHTLNCYTESLATCDAVLGRSRIAPHYVAWAHGLRATALADLGRFDEALVSLHAARTTPLPPGQWKEWVDANADLYVARVYVMQREWKTALANVDLALSRGLIPGDRAHALLLRARCLIGLGRHAEAQAEWRLAGGAGEVTTGTTSYPAYVDRDGWIVDGLLAEAQDDPDRAAQSYEAAAKRGERDPEPRYRLGCLFTITQPEQARRWFQQAIDVNFASYYAQLAKQELARMETGNAK